MTYSLAEISTSNTAPSLDWHVKTEYDLLVKFVESGYSSDLNELNSIHAFGVCQKHLLTDHTRRFKEDVAPSSQCFDPDLKIVEMLKSTEQTVKEMSDLCNKFLDRCGSSSKMQSIIVKIREVQDDLIHLHNMLQEFRWMILVHDGSLASPSGRFATSGENFHAAMTNGQVQY